jgi:hypothetical protein
MQLSILGVDRGKYIYRKLIYQFVKHKSIDWDEFTGHKIKNNTTTQNLIINLHYKFNYKFTL